MIVIVAAVVILMVIMIAVWYFLSGTDEKSPTPTPTPTPTPDPVQTPMPEQPFPPVEQPFIKINGTTVAEETVKTWPNQNLIRVDFVTTPNFVNETNNDSLPSPPDGKYMSFDIYQGSADVSIHAGDLGYGFSTKRIYYQTILPNYSAVVFELADTESSQDVFNIISSLGIGSKQVRIFAAKA